MVKYIFILSMLSFVANAQENDKIMEPIHQLFTAMEKGDSASAHNAFYGNPTFKTVLIDSKTNQPVLRTDGFAGFLKSIGTPHAEVYHELIWSPVVQIDGNFAQVWTPYAFYLGKTFHHCGVDAYHLFKDANGKWKIFNLTDTRQTVGCNVPKEVSEKMK